MPRARLPVFRRGSWRERGRSWTFTRVEKFFPVRPLFFKRRRAVTDLHLAGGAVVIHSGIAHVAQVLAARDGTGAQRAAIDRLDERLLFCPVVIALRTRLSHDDSILRGIERREYMRGLKRQGKMQSQRSMHSLGIC